MGKTTIYLFGSIIVIGSAMLWYFTRPVVFHPVLLQIVEKSDITGSELLSDLEQVQRTKRPTYILCKPHELASNFRNLNIAADKSDGKMLICIGAAAEDVVVESDDLTPRGNKYYVAVEFGEITGDVYIYSYENDRFMLAP